MYCILVFARLFIFYYFWTGSSQYDILLYASRAAPVVMQVDGDEEMLEEQLDGVLLHRVIIAQQLHSAPIAAVLQFQQLWQPPVGCSHSNSYGSPQSGAPISKVMKEHSRWATHKTLFDLFCFLSS